MQNNSRQSRVVNSDLYKRNDTVAPAAVEENLVQQILGKLRLLS